MAETMKSDLFQHELTNTSAVFGRHGNVKVVFKGDQACTDNDTIWLPALPGGVDVSEDVQAIMRGYVDHEAGHVRRTNMEFIKKQQRVLDANPALHGVWNALEDVWLEQGVIHDYPGAEKNLRATAEAVDRKALKDIPKGDERWLNDKFVGPVAITWQGRKDYGHSTGEECLKRCSPEVQKASKWWADAAKRCTKTEELFELAKMIHGQLETGVYENPITVKVTVKGAGEGEGEGEGEGDGLGRAASEEFYKGEETETYTEEEGNPDGGGNGMGAGGKDVVKRTTTVADIKPYDPSLENVVKAAVQTVMRAAGKEKKVYRPYSTASDKFHHRTDAFEKYGTYTFGRRLKEFSEAYKDVYQRRLNDASGNVNVVRRKLERVLLAQQNRGWSSGHESGKLDTRRLVQAMRAEPNVYKLREPVAELDTAVQFLVDLSGSMDGDKAELARDVVVILSEVMQKVGIAFEVLGFNNRTGVIEGRGGGRMYTVSGYSRVEPLDIYIFKSFDERLSDAKGVIGTLNTWAGGNNTDGEALMYAFQRLAKRKEKRRVMLTLSDGAPAGHGDMDAMAWHLAEVVKSIASRGVECIGIGIMDHNVRKFYPRHVVVHDLNHLATKAIDQLAKVLVGEDYVADNADLLRA